MPRRSSGSGFGGRTSSPPPRSTATAQRPAPVQQAPPAQAPTQSSGGMFSGMGGMLMSGMAFGAGSEVAHQAIRAVTGSGSHSQQAPAQQQQQQPVQQQQQQTQVCGDQMTNFSTCLKSQSQISMCQPYLDMLKECQKSNNLSN